MLLDIQDQFREEYKKAAEKGRMPNLPPGYSELYRKWLQIKKETVYKLSYEEVAQSFSDFLRSEIREKTVEIIDRTAKTERARLSLHQLAIRGRVLLVSSDGGKNFDKILADSDLSGVSAINYMIVSPTFRSTTTNFKEVLDEQSLLYVAKKLRDQKFKIQSAWIDENRKIHIRIVPRGGIKEISVDLRQDLSKPLLYDFINSKGVKKAILETQLPEEFGELFEKQIWGKAKKSIKDPAGFTDTATNTAFAAANAANIANLANQVNAEAAFQAQKRAEEQMSKPLMAGEFQTGGGLSAGKGGTAKLSGNLSNVMASKAAVKARMARHEKKMEEDGKRARELQERKRQEEEEKRSERRKRIEISQKRRGEKGKSLMKKGAIGAGLTGVLGGVCAGTTLFITNINTIL